MSSDASVADSELPAVDERLVAPDTRYEIIDGLVVHVPPAYEPHGARHSKISALVEAHAGADFEVASDMLTRTSNTSDFAPDVSVFPRARNPATGGRQLEQLAFEVVSTESLAHAGRKAALLVARGVRRVFAIDIERVRALEWSSVLETWSVLDTGGELDDPALAAPLPIDALLRAVKADDAMARALIVKRNPEIEAVRAQDRAEGLVEGKRAGLIEGKRAGLIEGKRAGLVEGKRAGLVEGKRAGLVEGVLLGKAEAVVDLLAARGIAVADAERARILGEQDPARITRWLARAATCATAAALFAEA